MLVDLKHINVGPRTDGGPKEAKPKTAMIYDRQNNLFRIEVTDTANPEFRMVLFVTEQDLKDRNCYS